MSMFILRTPDSLSPVHYVTSHGGGFTIGANERIESVETSTDRTRAQRFTTPVSRGLLSLFVAEPLDQFVIRYSRTHDNVSVVYYVGTGGGSEDVQDALTFHSHDEAVAHLHLAYRFYPERVRQVWIEKKGTK